MKVLLKTIRDKSPCKSGWETLLKSLTTQDLQQEVTINQLLESNGVSDTLWVIFKCIEGEIEAKRNMFTGIMESILHIYENKFLNDARMRTRFETMCNIDAIREELYAVYAASSVYATYISYIPYVASVADVAVAKRKKQKKIILKWFGE